MTLDYTYRPDFEYKHQNPYHDRLSDFQDFVMRDKESEIYAGLWNEKVFQRTAPLLLEIGTGYGEFMQHFCQVNPQVNFVGLDFRFRRSFELAKKLNKIENKNFRYLRARGERISLIFNENELDHIFYFFPDPWPKKRHNKKRLFQKSFLESAYKVLRPGGKIFIKTDHDDYAEWMEKEIADCSLFRLLMKSRDLRADFPQHFLSSFETKFEKIFLKNGIKIKAFVLESTRRETEGFLAADEKCINQFQYR